MPELLVKWASSGDRDVDDRLAALVANFAMAQLAQYDPSVQDQLWTDLDYPEVN